METALKIFLEQGVMGAVTILSIGWAVYKEKETRRLYETLVAKIEGLNAKYHEALLKMSDTVNALTRYDDEEDE